MWNLIINKIKMSLKKNRIFKNFKCTHVESVSHAFLGYANKHMMKVIYSNTEMMKNNSLEFLNMVLGFEESQKKKKKKYLNNKN